MQQSQQSNWQPSRACRKHQTLTGRFAFLYDWITVLFCLVCFLRALDETKRRMDVITMHTELFVYTWCHLIDFKKAGYMCGRPCRTFPLGWYYDTLTREYMLNNFPECRRMCNRVGTRKLIKVYMTGLQHRQRVVPGFCKIHTGIVEVSFTLIFFFL